MLALPIHVKYNLVVWHISLMAGETLCLSTHNQASQMKSYSKLKGHWQLMEGARQMLKLDGHGQLRPP